ncbi:MAG: hypothetical protein R8K22_00490 [Mariprofundaceae bacterium]
MHLLLVGCSNASVALLVALLAQLLGAMADQGGLKNVCCSVFQYRHGDDSLTFLIAERHWQLALIVYVFASIGFSSVNVFYDALIVDVSEGQRLDRVSALGYALGYAGGGLCVEFYDAASQ